MFPLFKPCLASERFAHALARIYLALEHLEMCEVQGSIASTDAICLLLANAVEDLEAVEEFVPNSPLLRNTNENEVHHAQ